MKLTKKIEAEIRKVYKAYWDSYLSGDLKTMGGFLTDGFTLIGTSGGEVFNNKKSAMKYLEATIDQVAGILSKKNIEIKIAKVDDTVLVTEFFDAYVNTGDLPAFYGKFRATSVMRRVRGKWKIIHQHGSLPDSKADVGETLATEKVKKENRELRDAVKRRTHELEQKNRDLEIEASLEKVRARTMAMQSSSELADLIAVIHSEIGRLDKNLDRSFILLFDDDGSSTWWMSGNEKMPLNRSYYVKHNKHAPYLACLKGWRKGEREWRYVLKGAEKKKWDDYIFKESELAQLPKVVKSNMAGAKVAHWSSSFNKYGCISTGSFEPLGASSFDLMVRFSRMFEQTYTRFLDLKKAEAQTREAQIELSLERVRARAMAMQSSTELGALIGMIYTELMRLDMNLNRCFIVLFDDTGNSTWWMASNESTDLNRGYFVPYSEHPFNLACLDGWRRQELKWTYVLEGKGKKSWDEFIFGKTEMALVPRFIIDNMRAFGRAYVVAPFNKYGCIMAGSTTAPIPASSFDLLIKFSRTFEQTYTRFLDLKKAEAQARESQIQLALERVRARTMGMQHSDELQEAANLLFKQVQSLEIPVWSCGYNIWEKHEKVCTGWMSTNDTIQPSFKIPLTESPTFIRFYKSRKKNEDFYVEKVEGKSLADHYKYLFSLRDFAKSREAQLKAGFKLPKSQFNHVANFAHGNLVFITAEPVPDAWDIFKRFAKVFEQTYTRFLDLKRTEAQAREAQVEVALERIRSRSLAMHHSNEITDVIGIVFRQLSELKVLHGTVGIQLVDFETKDSVFWPGNTLQSPAPKVMIPYDEKIMNRDDCLRDIWHSMSTGKTIFNKVYTKKQKDRYFKYVFANNSLDVIFEQSRKIIQQVKSLTLCFIPEKNSALYADSFDGTLYTEEEFIVLKRTAKVFEQAYIRFLDLQKAEAQAREAQIEAALERVRSRSMAMQNSDELTQVASLLFRQVKDLGIHCWTTGFNVWSEDGNSYVDYVTDPVGEMMEPYTIDTTRFPLLEEVSIARKRGESFHVRFETGEEIKKTYEFLQETADKKQFQKILDSGFNFPKQQINHFVFGSKVSLLFITYDHVPEAHDIFKRFGKVFEQVYTRFLDLKNAEAQARESQIQLALERIRARTMAMHNSSELADVAVVLFEQLKQLGAALWICGFNICDKDSDVVEGWACPPDGTLMEPLYVPNSIEPFQNRAYETWKNGGEMYSDEMEGEELRVGHEALLAHPSMEGPRKYLKEKRIPMPTWVQRHAAIHKYGFLQVVVTKPFEETQIFIRFAKVFEQTYTRFLDLKNAEAQARESQIQLALERVRARTMAMQKSPELNDVATLLFQQVSELGIKAWTAGFNLWSDDGNFYTDFVASPQGNVIESYTIDATKFPVFVEVANARRSGVDFWVSYLEGDLLKETYRQLARFDSEAQYQKMLEDGYKYPSHQYNHFVFGSKVSLMFITYDPVPEAHDIFKRFGVVFEQAYRRFLDLQKAEAQAREAQIEAALEKVRSASLAMHHSDELENVVAVLFDKLEELGVVFDGALIYTFDRVKRSMDCWVAALVLEAPVKISLPFSDDFSKNQVAKDLWNAIENGEHYLNKVYSGKAKDDYSLHVIQYNRDKVPEDVSNLMLAANNWTVTFAAEKNSVIGFDSWSGHLTSEVDFELLKRFSRVFEQAYVRFLDLQRSEAQAREAQIEAALERVRSRTMAMHKSDELLDVITVVSEQLQHVGIKFGTVSFGKNSLVFDMDFWVAAPDLKQPIKMSAPYTNIPIYNRLIEAHREKRNFFSDTFTAEETRVWNQHIIDHNPELFSEKSRGYLTSRPGMTRSTVLLKNVFLFLINYDFVTYSKEEIEIVVRFANVFEQTYTRFLDLQKAEAQAREAQIESALEKIRSRSLAMHHSGELKDVVAIMFEKMKELNVVLGTIAIQLFDQNTMNSTFWAGNNLHDEPPKVKLPYYEKMLEEDGYMKDSWESKNKSENLINKEYTFDQKTRFFDFVFASNDLSTISAADRDIIRQNVINPRSSYIVCLINEKNSSVFADSWNGEFYSEESIKVLTRAAKVFEQAYVRFLDLQKAEAQARESQIEAALERVRSRTMAMHKSEELLDVIVVVSQQLTQLDFRFDVVSFARNSEMHDYRFWFCQEKAQQAHEIHVPYLNNPMFERIKGVMARGEKFYADTLTVAENSEWIEHMLAHDAWPGLTDEVKNFLLTRGYARSIVFMPQIMLILGNFFLKPYSEEQNNILKRFAAVFEQSYTRFLDLQKAEAQAREAQIEVALERVRAKAMAMHSAQQLSEVVRELRTQMGLLGQKGLNTCVIHLHDESPEFIHAWAAIRLPDRADEIREFNTLVPKVGLAIIEEALMAYAAGRQDYVLVNDGDKFRQWGDFMSRAVPGAHQLMVESIASEGGVENSFWAFADFQGGSLLAVSVDPPEESSRILLRRFANVFGLAYRRFADLKKAEVQAREATIEAALEKIRSRSLGMHKSEEILDVVAILFGKLKELGLVFDGGAAIHLFSEASKNATIWVMSPELSKPIVNTLPYDEVVADNPIIKDVWKAKDTGQHITNRHYSFEEKREYFEYVFKHNANQLSGEVKDFIRSAKSYTANFIAEKNSLLGASSWTGQEFSEGDIEVLKRVARVFEQAYIRFLDLQKAEAQAREATIEAALEKIRSRSLGMHQSHELNDVVAILFEKLKELDLPFDGGAGLFLFSEGSRDTSFWVTNGYIPPVCNYLPYDESDFSDNAIMQDIWKAKDSGEPIVNKHYSSEEKNKLFSYTSKYNDETKIPEAERIRVFEATSYTATFIPERNSLLSVDSWTNQTMSVSDIEILKRFARVFEQAYVRFLDLQKAEIHAKKAVCQASLDRVRAEIASMRTVEDLDRITPLIWRELHTIGIPFIRCGVFIMDEPNRVVHTFLSTPDGKAIAVFQLPFDTPGRLGPIVPHWQDKKIFLDYWDEVAMKGVADTLVSAGIFSSPQQYLATLPKEGFHLHLLPFAQGMLYVANLTQLKDEELALLQSLADAFATAYARYDDFNKLESAKQQVDRTLIDLRQAQQQLVQSEKMASLGELTAGIAHEIQNPLNFVNNFSEVSNELIDEMKTELQAGNLKDVAELAESIKQNLEKITHHGKRADGIVKGMLQHSRAGSGQKEPTDLNFLCDEYLRLAYHGYRAKEKSFNAKFESDFDPTLPKINVVAQDIGRVILNLINNAFFAVSEMKKLKVDGYEPKVSVITRNLPGKAEIRVKDNGIGISEKVKEKIFQPFFTTKPTGQGTGLGLSLSYDIIKAHGGTLEVMSTEGKGSEFAILLPI